MHPFHERGAPLLHPSPLPPQPYCAMQINDHDSYLDLLFVKVKQVLLNFKLSPSDVHILLDYLPLLSDPTLLFQLTSLQAIQVISTQGVRKLRTINPSKS